MVSHEFNVIIMGRPNVGKSSLFNRLIGRKRALVHNTLGVTRDYLVETTSWIIQGQVVSIQLFDTGGVSNDRDLTPFMTEVFESVVRLLKTPAVVCWVFDVREGLTLQDVALWEEVQKRGLLKDKVVLAVANKADHDRYDLQASVFYQLGCEIVLSVSAEHNLGIDELKDAIIEHAHWNIHATETSVSADEEQEQQPFRIAVVGRPNVGKSTLVNALLGEQRLITSPIPGTTTDLVDVPVMWGEDSYSLIDTAGIRKKSKTQAGLEVLSVVQTKKALEKAQLALLVVDGQVPLTTQDAKVASLMLESECAVIVVVNKWDDTSLIKRAARDYLLEEMPFLDFAPIIFVSAQQAKGLHQIPKLVKKISRNYAKRIVTHELTECIRKAALMHNPKNAKFYYCHQSSQSPPKFVFHVNDPEKIDIALRRHLVRSMRAHWDWTGIPLWVKIKEAERKSLPGCNDQSSPRKKQMHAHGDEQTT